MIDPAEGYALPEEPQDPALESLAALEPDVLIITLDEVEAQEEAQETLVEKILEGTMDSRDFTQEPPAYMDPESVRRNRERVRQYLAVGKWSWPLLNGEAA